MRRRRHNSPPPRSRSVCSNHSISTRSWRVLAAMFARGGLTNRSWHTRQSLQAPPKNAPRPRPHPVHRSKARNIQHCDQQPWERQLRSVGAACNAFRAIGAILKPSRTLNPTSLCHDGELRLPCWQDRRFQRGTNIARIVAARDSCGVWGDVVAPTILFFYQARATPAPAREKQGS